MKEIIPLHFETRDIRMLWRDGEPWFVLSDVAKTMNLKNSRDIASRLDDDEKADVGLTDTRSGQKRKMTVISEPALMLVVMRSDAALKRGTVAYRFRRWVTHEVLPSIRKFGMYPPPSADLIAANDPYVDMEKPLPERFKEERLRWENETGYAFAKVPGFSAAIIRSIEGGLGGSKKPNRVWAMIQSGIDVRYVMSGVRNITPIERGFIDRLRENRAFILEE